MSQTQTHQDTLAEARKSIASLDSLAKLLGISNLSQETLSICVAMIENGVNPESLAAVVREISKEREAITL